MHPEFLLEQKRLESVLDYLRFKREEAIQYKKSIDENVSYSLKHYNSDNTEQYIELIKNTNIQASLKLRVSSMERSVKKPYFARVDFKPDDADKTESYYIGKMALMRDEDLTPLIIDWRAPVSILYYEERIGRAAYNCPDGHIEGEIFMKRQFIVENAQLKDMFDIDITTNDEFLQAALGSNKDNRLKDIVSTIQAEQNRVIRARLDKTLIVQGAAGGGKTTIALHRIAYLLYNYENVLSPKNVMIIAPNRFFLSYISEVLPELGVEHVRQTTFDDFAREFTGTKLEVKDPAIKLKYMINHPEHAGLLARSAQLKSSMNFKSLINNYISDILLSIFPNEDFTIEGYTLYTRKKIIKLLCEDYIYLPVEKRLSEIKKYLLNTLKVRIPEIIAEIELEADRKANSIKKKMEDCEERRGFLIELFDARDTKIKLIKEKSRTAVKSYFKKAELYKAHEYYIRLFDGDNLKRAGRYIFPLVDITTIKLLSDKTILKSNHVFEMEDLAAIMHIQFMFYGNGDYELRHIVIDEAQDVSPFQLFVLKEIMGTPSFSILGDLYQGVYSYRGIQDWQQVEKLFDDKANYLTLEQSYRTTVEVMDFANYTAGMMKNINEPKAKPVIRHGKPVKVIETVDNTAGIHAAAADMAYTGLKSVSIICKTVEECIRLNERLEKLGGSYSVITEREENYGGGTVIIPCYLAKGLEFDGVIIADASREAYGDSELDCKLLYVALTRAMHELVIFSLGPLSPLLCHDN